MIRLNVPSVDESDSRAVTEVLKTGFLVQGPQVIQFEKDFADYVGVEHAVAVSNCKAALQMALLALEIQRGDRVIVPAYSWMATANVVELCGAEPVFIDINPLTFAIDPALISEKLKALGPNHKVKAIIPVHAFGWTADMASIMAVADRFNISVIEDAACAVGANFNGKKAGSIGKIGCFSFHPRKVITTGEGGMLVTSSADLAKRVRVLRNHGIDPDASLEFIAPGFNNRMTDFQAALGIQQLRKLEHLLEIRASLAARYNDLLSGLPLLKPEIAGGRPTNFQSYVIQLPLNLMAQRDRIIKAMRSDGVEVTVGTCHMPMGAYFKSRYGYKAGDFPVTDSIAARSVTLPLHHLLTSEDQLKVVELLRSHIAEVNQ